jgi:hypothetical protein
MGLPFSLLQIVRVFVRSNRICPLECSHITDGFFALVLEGRSQEGHHRPVFFKLFILQPTIRNLSLVGGGKVRKKK